MKNVIKALKAGNTKKAEKLFDKGVEADTIDLDEVVEMAESLASLGLDDIAVTLTDWHAAYDDGDDDTEVEAKAAKVIDHDSEYFRKGRLNLLDRYIDDCFGDYVDTKHKNYRFRVKHGSTSLVEAMYLNKYWHMACDMYAEESIELAMRFTHGIRHQIQQLTAIDSPERKKALKDIPLPTKLAELYE